MQPDKLQDRIKHCLATHSKSMLRMAFAYLRNAQDAEDVTQEVFLSYFRAAPVFNDDNHEKAWLLRSTINRCKNVLKSAQRRREIPMPEFYSGITAEESGLLHEVLALDEMYRLPIHLHYYEGYSLKDIAEILGEKPATIGTRLSRGREQLKQALGGISNA